MFSYLLYACIYTVTYNSLYTIAFTILKLFWLRNALYSIVFLQNCLSQRFIFKATGAVICSAVTGVTLLKNVANCWTIQKVKTFSLKKHLSSLYLMPGTVFESQKYGTGVEDWEALRIYSLGVHELL